MPKLNSGRFITLEGGEGTGKSTLANGLVKLLEASNHKVLLTREPGGTPVAEAVRNICLFPPEESELSPMTQALLMNAARKDHLEKAILPALEADHWVICDRFSDSTKVYQSVEGELSMADLVRLETFVVADHLPDLTLVLDASESKTLERRKARNSKLDNFEKKDATYHKAVKDAFRSIAETESERCRLIDADQNAEKVLEDACQILSERFGVNLT